MKQKKINSIKDEADGLFSTTAQLINKCADLLTNEIFEDKDAELIATELLQVLGENGEKMPKYLVNALLVKLNGNIEATKLEFLYDELMEEVKC